MQLDGMPDVANDESMTRALTDDERRIQHPTRILE